MYNPTLTLISIELPGSANIIITMKGGKISGTNRDNKLQRIYMVFDKFKYVTIHTLLNITIIYIVIYVYSIPLCALYIFTGYHKYEYKPCLSSNDF